jgi:hypothetical protein
VYTLPCDVAWQPLKLSSLILRLTQRCIVLMIEAGCIEESSKPDRRLLVCLLARRVTDNFLFPFYVISSHRVLHPHPIHKVYLYNPLVTFE